MKTKTIHFNDKLIEEAKSNGFSYGIKWENKELGVMIDLYTYPKKGSKKLSL